MCGVGFLLLRRLANAISDIIDYATVVSLEKKKVADRQATLEMDTLSEMLLESPHSAVNSIAAQALAGSWKGGRDHAPVSLEARHAVARLFYDRFKWWDVPEGGKPTLITGSETTTERLARACLNVHPGTLFRTPRTTLYEYSAARPDDLRVVALYAAALSKDSELPEADQAEMNGALVRRILARPREATNEVPPWVKDRLLDSAIMSARQKVHNTEDWNVWFDRFLQNLSLDRPQTLQDEMFIGMIGSRPTAEEMRQKYYVRERYTKFVLVWLERYH